MNFAGFSIKICVKSYIHQTNKSAYKPDQIVNNTPHQYSYLVYLTDSFHFFFFLNCHHNFLSPIFISRDSNRATDKTVSLALIINLFLNSREKKSANADIDRQVHIVCISHVPANDPHVNQ